ncbi:hypothetical protein GJ496_008419 [Pomphorhynchus laevis]|nr:hypothetical protein GJ496_008419 [Pomphorhynchus laevis]
MPSSIHTSNSSLQISSSESSDLDIEGEDIQVLNKFKNVCRVFSFRSWCNELLKEDNSRNDTNNQKGAPQQCQKASSGSLVIDYNNQRIRKGRNYISSINLPTGRGTLALKIIL